MPIGPAPDHLVRDSGGDGAAKAGGRWHKVARDWGEPRRACDVWMQKSNGAGSMSQSEPARCDNKRRWTSERESQEVSWPSSPAISFLSISCPSDFHFLSCQLDTRLDCEISTLRLCHSVSLVVVVVVESTNSKHERKRGRKYSRAWQAHHRPIFDGCDRCKVRKSEIEIGKFENDAGSQANWMAARRWMTSGPRAGPNPSSTTSERQSPPCLQQVPSHGFIMAMIRNFSVQSRPLLGCTNEAGDQGRLNLESPSSARAKRYPAP